MALLAPKMCKGQHDGHITTAQVCVDSVYCGKIIDVGLIDADVYWSFSPHAPERITITIRGNINGDKEK